MGQIATKYPPVGNNLINVVVYFGQHLETYATCNLVVKRDQTDGDQIIDAGQLNDFLEKLDSFASKVREYELRDPVIAVTANEMTPSGLVELSKHDHLKLPVLAIEQKFSGLQIHQMTDRPAVEPLKHFELQFKLPLHPDYRHRFAKLIVAYCLKNQIWVKISDDAKNVTSCALANLLLNSPSRLYSSTVAARPDVRDGNGIYFTGGIDKINGADAVLRGTAMYNDESKKFEKGPSLTTARHSHVAVRMPNGDIIVAGGLGNFNKPLLTCERLTAGDTEFRLMYTTLNQPRVNAAATVSPDGTLFICGGEVGPDVLDTVEYMDSNGTFRTLGRNMSIPRKRHTITWIPDHGFLICGGEDANGNKTDTTEMYDDHNVTFTPRTPLSEPLSGHCAALLLDGRIFIYAEKIALILDLRTRKCQKLSSALYNAFSTDRQCAS